MNLKKLCTALHNSAKVDGKIAVLQRHFAMLALNLGAMIPANAKVFEGLIDNLNKELNEDYKFFDYFSGNGPMASRLVEHLCVSSMVHPDNTSSRLDLTAFDFKPVNNEICKVKLNSFLTGAVIEVSESEFLSINNSTLDLSQPDSLSTGIYKSPHSESPTLVLRTVSEDRCGVEALFIATPGKMGELWYYHPYELVWVFGDEDYIFTGMQESLELEFEKAKDKACQTFSDFDFDKEISKLDEQSDFIFDNESSVLPEVAFNGLANESKNPDVSTGFFTKPDYSLILISLDNTVLLFRNTKADYPSRNRQIMINWPYSPSVLHKDNLSTGVQQLLIKKSKLVLKVLTEHINKTKGA
jgi:hypothetical protein